MKTQTLGIMVLICLGGLLVAGLRAQNAGVRASRDKRASWQHMALSAGPQRGVADPGLSRQINQLGREGWELVDVDHIVRDGTTEKTVYFFKRV